MSILYYTILYYTRESRDRLFALMETEAKAECAVPALRWLLYLDAWTPRRLDAWTVDVLIRENEAPLERRLRPRVLLE